MGVSAFPAVSSSAAPDSVEALGLRVSVPRGFSTVRMPHVLVSTQIRLETGPTIVGDETSDPVVMTYLGARKTTMLGNNFAEYHVDDPPRVVLDKLEKIGFRVVTMTGVGQTLVWCLHREAQ